MEQTTTGLISLVCIYPNGIFTLHFLSFGIRNMTNGKETGLYCAIIRPRRSSWSQSECSIVHEVSKWEAPLKNWSPAHLLLCSVHTSAFSNLSIWSKKNLLSTPHHNDTNKRCRYVKSVQKKVQSHHLDMSSTITISRNLIFLFGAKVMPKVYCNGDNRHTHSAGRVL